MQAELKSRLLKRIRSRSAVITIVGLGHVGLPLTIAFARRGFKTIGVDKNEARLASLRCGECHPLDDFVGRSLAELLNAKRITLTKETPRAIQDADCIAICVPTPVNKQNKPDTSIISEVLRVTGKCLSPGKLVVIESTVFPGFTDRVARRLLESGGLRCGTDFALAYSPERIDPGNRQYKVTQIPKIVGGVDELSGEIATLLYESVIEGGVFQVSSAKTAECTKMLENVYRFVNIALIDEFALFCQKARVDVFEVVSAASSKPFGFQPHYPGPGIGGPCIPKDPFYLQHAARRLGLKLNLVEASANVIFMMPLQFISDIMKEVRVLGQRIPKLSIFGLAYKAGSSDTVNSPAEIIVSRLLSITPKLVLYDPYVSSIRINGRVLKSEASAEVASTDSSSLIFLVDHELFKKLDLRVLKNLAAKRCVLFDAKNIFKAQDAEAAGFRYVGLGKPLRPRS